MRIFLNIYCKKIYINYSNKRLVSYRTRKNLCSLLSSPKVARIPGSRPHVKSLRNLEMGYNKLEINVITNGTFDSSSLLVDLGTCSYLFNCGENITRARCEIKHRGLPMKAIFVTSGFWRHVGGLLGTLACQRRSDQNLTLFGPPEVEELTSIFNVTNTGGSSVNFNVDSRCLKQTHDDGSWKVKIVPVCAELNETGMASTSKLTGDTEDCLKTKSQSQDKNRNSFNKRYVFNYICQSEDFGHHLDIEACKKRNVPIGPLLQTLKNKMDITLSNGDVVRWQEVCFTTNGQVNFLIADCPTVEYLENFLNEKEFASCQKGGEIPANLIVHFTPPEVMKTEKYFKWMLKFPSSAHHLLLNRDNIPISFFGAQDFHKQLTYMSRNIFPPIREEGMPVLKESYSDALWRTNFILTTHKPGGPKEEALKCINIYPAREVLIEMPDIFHSVNGMKVIRGILSLRYAYHPNPDNEWCFLACHNPKTVINRLFVPGNPEYEDEDAQAKLNDFKQKEKAWMETEACKEKPEYPKMFFLGTGSGEPAGQRSPSSILVYFSEDDVILLDCGEGTYSQMCKLFGPDKAEEIVCKLRIIFVSHYHMDHHGGLYGLLMRRLQLLENKKTVRKLGLMVPFQIRVCLGVFPSFYGPILKKTVVCDSNHKLMKHRYADLKTIFEGTAISKIETCFVSHCKGSCGISITLKNGYKITYSGDARPSKNLIQIGMNSDILIHEATFGDNLADMAAEKRHSTISEAIEMGRKMNAKHTILTHFSQRYAKVPLMDFQNFPNDVAIAFDFMMVNERVWPLIGKLMPLFPSFFGREIRLLKGKATAREMLKRVQAWDREEEEEEEDEISPPLKMKKENF